MGAGTPPRTSKAPVFNAFVTSSPVDCAGTVAPDTPPASVVSSGPFTCSPENAKTMTAGVPPSPSMAPVVNGTTSTSPVDCTGRAGTAAPPAAAPSSSIAETFVIGLVFPNALSKFVKKTSEKKWIHFVFRPVTPILHRWTIQLTHTGHPYRFFFCFWYWYRSPTGGTYRWYSPVFFISFFIYFFTGIGHEPGLSPVTHTARFFLFIYWYRPRTGPLTGNTYRPFFFVFLLVSSTNRSSHR
jgi:hypothetical protein